MSAKPDFDTAAVEAGLAGTQFSGRLNHCAVTQSTNTLAITAAQAGASGGVWVADEQTAGRGRGGHAWHSVVGDGLYVSVLLRPRLPGADALKISLAAGLAAQSAVATGAGVRIDLRWPNDLMIADKDGVERKFGGILTETAMSGRDGEVAYAVVGIGMNLNHAELPEELREIASSLRMVTGDRVFRERVLVALLRGLEQEMAMLEGEVAGNGTGESIRVRFARASSWVLGARVKVEEEGGYTGVTDGLDDRGLLRVRLEDGSRRVVRHGGVRRA